MNAVLFGGYTVLVAAAVVTSGFWWLPRRTAWSLAAALAGWFGWIGFLGGSGRMADPTVRPPALLFLAVPLTVFVGVLAWARLGQTLALAVPVPVLLGAQTFRVGVEWLLHRLWQAGLAPRMITWEGANFDVVIGLTAPLAAWVSTRGRGGARAALLWNVAGLAMLANVVLRAILTTPAVSLLEAEVPNLLPGLLPYTYLAGFLAPLALVLHTLAIRALLPRAR